MDCHNYYEQYYKLFEKLNSKILCHLYDKNLEQISFNAVNDNKYNCSLKLY